MIENVETTVERIFASPAYANVKNYNDSIQLIYKMINNSFTDYHWIMTMKQLKPKPASTSDSYYYNCFNCFTSSDLGKQYEYMVAGVPKGTTPNTDYLTRRAYFTEMNNYSTARDIANQVFNGFCLEGVQTVATNEDLANIYPLEWNGVSERSNDPGTFIMRFWSIKEECPNS